MALYGYQPPSADGFSTYTPPAPDGFSAYKPPRRKKPVRPHRQTFHRPRPVAPVRQHPFDPLAPTPDATLRTRAQGLVQSELGPLLQQIQAAIEARSKSGQAAIAGYTKTLGGLESLYAPQSKAAYGEAIGNAQQVNSELANRLGSFGQNTGAEVAKKLDYAPASTQSNLAAGATNTATGAANANFASGAADVSKLIAESAHAQDYGAKLPGIAGLTGLQHAKDLERELNAQLAQELADASSKAQQTFTDIYLHYVDNEMQKTLARQSGQFKSAQAEADARYRAQQIAYKRADLDYRKAKAKADRIEKGREADRRANIAGRNAQTSAQRAAESARHNRQNERNQNLRQNKWATNPDGSFKYRKNKKTGKQERIPLPGGKKSGGSSSGL